MMPVITDAEELFSDLTARLELSYRALVWDALSGTLRGASRGPSDQWNRNVPLMLQSRCVVLGAGPSQNATRDWTGGHIEFASRVHPRLPRRIQNASVAIFIPPGDGKGIHGFKGSVIRVLLRGDDGHEIVAARTTCRRPGRFLNYYCHAPGDLAPRVHFNKRAVALLNQSRSVSFRIVAPEHSCADMYRVCLHVNENVTCNNGRSAPGDS
jgi:hypothetical protein